MKLEGSFVALVTPYTKGEVDLKKVRELVDFHVKNGTNGICPVATTGEGVADLVVASALPQVVTPAATCASKRQVEGRLHEARNLWKPAPLTTAHPP